MASSDLATAATTFTLELQTGTEEEHTIYAVGNFNKWRIADKAYQMQLVSPGHYKLVLEGSELPPVLEYKYARGSWDYVELSPDGSDRPNRRVALSQQKTMDQVDRWKQDTLDYKVEYLPVIELIEDDIAMPDSVRTRRIAALLPHDYYQSDRHYPVLYLQDGQNLFDDYAPFGNWAVDKRMAQLQAEGKGDVIIIAIDHAMDKRIVEFTPSSATTRFGRGQGRTYVRFLAENLKPYIDNKFRTLADCHNTGIGGSSMGGLISIYAGMMYPKTFGRLMIFSPALWVTPNIPFQLVDLKQAFTGRVYLYGGRKESDTMVPNLKRLRKALQKKSEARKAKFLLSVDPNGEHNEARWGEEFPAALSWLFFPDQKPIPSTPKTNQ